MDAPAARQQATAEARDKPPAATEKKPAGKDDEAAQTSPGAAAPTPNSSTADLNPPAGVPPELAAMLAALATRNTAPAQAAIASQKLDSTSAASQPLFDAKPSGDGHEALVQWQGEPGFFAASSAPAGNAVKFADALANAGRDLAPVTGNDKSAGELQLQMQPGDLQPGFSAAHAAALAGLHGGAPGAASSEQPVSLQVQTPAGQPGWAEDVGNRISWVAGRGESKAELVLTPAHLGKIEITISVNGDQTSAQFVAATPAARDALEQALPRLRETLADAGISLGQTSVGTSSGQSDTQGDSGRQGRSSGRARSIGGVSPNTTGSARWTQSGVGLVDTFA
ncbi:MAG: hypothetical protein HGA47_01135 [Zoogloea sp.]|nr:hypothetical protein [Zoogloea sp.]